MSGSGLPPLRPPGPDRLRGGRIVLTGLIAGLVSLLLARFLTMIVASTPTRIATSDQPARDGWTCGSLASLIGLMYVFAGACAGFMVIGAHVRRGREP